MATITPGKDFYVNETPTRATLQQMATGLQITGIPLSSLESGLAIVTVTDNTSASNLANEGLLWVDSNNNIWGKTADGAVKVRRYPGGWETNRFLCFGDGAGQPAPVPGVIFCIDTSSANSTNLDSTRLQRGRQTGYNGTQLQPFMNQETTPSLADTHFRFTGRGATRIYSPGFLPGSVNPRMKAHFNAPSSGYLLMVDFESDTIGLQAESDEREPEVGSGISEARGYFMGLVIRRVP